MKDPTHPWLPFRRPGLWVVACVLAAASGLAVAGFWLAVPQPPGAVALGSRQVWGSREQSDAPLQFAVWWEEVRRLVRDGEPPWISPRLGGGVPLFANGQSGLPWPLQLPVWLWGPEVGSSLMALLKLLLAFWGMEFWLRTLAVTNPARRLASLAFPFSLNFISWLAVPLTWVLAFAPWSLGLLARALRGQKRAGSWLAVLLGALLGWSTHPETAAFLALASALVGLALAWPKARRLKRMLLPLSLAGVIGGGFGLPVILTIADSAKAAAAGAPTEDLPLGQKLAIASLLLVPFRHGHPAQLAFDFPFPHAPVALAFGSVALLVVLSGHTRPRHRRWVLALALVAVGSFLCFFQPPGVRELLTRAPLLRLLTWPRVGFLLPLALLALAALRWTPQPKPAKLAAATVGLQASLLLLAASAKVGTGLWVWPTALTPTVAALWWRAWPQGLAWLALGEMAFWSLPLVPISRPAPVDPLLLQLAQRAGLEERVLAVGEVVPANWLARLGLADLRSHDPVRPRSLAQVHRALGAGGADLPGPVTRPWAALAGAWGVRWLLTGPQGLPECCQAGWEEVGRSDRLRLYRNQRYLAPFRLVREVVPSPGPPREGAWEVLDFSQQAVGERPQVFSGQARWQLLERRPWRLRVRVQVEGQVLLAWHVPHTVGWQVRVDGRSVPFVRVNLAAMAVAVGDGEHEVCWEYHPPGWVAGVLLGALGLAAAWIGRRRRRRSCV